MRASFSFWASLLLHLTPLLPHRPGPVHPSPPCPLGTLPVWRPLSQDRVPLAARDSLPRYRHHPRPPQSHRRHHHPLHHRRLTQKIAPPLSPAAAFPCPALAPRPPSQPLLCAAEGWPPRPWPPASPGPARCRASASGAAGCSALALAAGRGARGFRAVAAAVVAAAAGRVACGEKGCGARVARRERRAPSSGSVSRRAWSCAELSSSLGVDAVDGSGKGWQKCSAYLPSNATRA